KAETHHRTGTVSPNGPPSAPQGLAAGNGTARRAGEAAPIHACSQRGRVATRNDGAARAGDAGHVRAEARERCRVDAGGSEGAAAGLPKRTKLIRDRGATGSQGGREGRTRGARGGEGPATTPEGGRGAGAVAARRAACAD